MSHHRQWRAFIVVIILFTTVLAFGMYFIHHPEVRRQLNQTSPQLLFGLVVLYAMFIGALALINNATLRMCRTPITGREGLLLTMYSSVINFFGPLQSGPAFRALYLRRKPGFTLKQFTTATMVYYVFYAIFSGLFLLSGLLGWWLLILIIFGLVIGKWAYGRQLGGSARFRKVDLSIWYLLGLATLLQVCIQAIIYYLELRSITPNVGIGQAIIYTGAANFALFVSITPGAIGFRESFLLFSQRLHHISNDAIVVATTIDRAAYIIVLLLAAALIFGSHAHKQIASKAAEGAQPK